MNKPRNSRRKGALERLRKQLEAPKLPLSPQDIARIEREIKALEERIV